MAEPTGVGFHSTAGRWILAATVLASGMVMLDGTVVNIALPAIGTDFGAEIAGLQWVLTGYLVTLSALILAGGSLGDIFGRRRLLRIGVLWFTGASALCAVAPTLGVLVAARALQGAGGALLVPGSLAIIEASYVPDDRGRAIGAWSGLAGVATAIGPLAGGALVSIVSWRLIFVINLPLAAVVLWASRHVPESSDPGASRRVDVGGAVLAVAGLAGVTFALTQGPSGGDPAVAAAIGIGGAAALVAFVVVEHRSRQPMLPLQLFGSRQFSVANLLTFVVYAALSVVLFLLAVQLEQVLGYSALAAGAALLPITLLMLAFSARSGQLAQRIGPRLPMTLGPAVIAGGLLLMVRIGAGASYWLVVLPAVVVFGAGLVLTVAPLTTTVLGAVDAAHAGVASGVNNAVARVGGLLAVALVPPLVGLTGSAYTMPVVFSAGFHSAVLLAAGLCGAGAVLAGFGIVNPGHRPRPHRHGPSCPLDAPDLRPGGTGVPS